MDEAELLCTRIGIMVKGDLKCLGNQLHLKNKFGQGYSVRVSFESSKQEADIREWMEDLGLVLVNTFRGTLEYHIKDVYSY